MNINNFIHELGNTIQELYGIKIESAVESLAVNHVISNLELGLLNVHVRQLANPNTKLESILELLETKVGGNPLHIGATAWNLSIKEDRMDCLEKMVTNLTASVSELTSEVGNQRKSRPNENTVCKHCQKAGHQQENCFQLKTCYHCKRQGHIARHCRSGESINKGQGHEQATDKLRMRADKSHKPEQPIEKIC